MYKDILLPIDLNHKSSWRSSLPVALGFCKCFNARLHVLTVIPDLGMSIVGDSFPADFEKKRAKAVNKMLHAFVKEQIPAEVNVQHIVADGTAYKEILSIAEQIKADLIVMGSHRPSLKDYLLGPNSERVVRHSPISVLVVRDNQPNDSLL